jgi:hypothetical protein
MRVTLLVEAGDPHGLAALADRLNGHGGFEATVWEGPTGGAVSATDVADTGAEGSAAGAPAAGLTVATGRRTAPLLDDAAPGRGVLLLMEMEDRALPAGSADAEAAAAIFTLPVPVIVPARWMAGQLAQLRPAGAPPAEVVRPGVEGATFAAPAPAPALAPSPGSAVPAPPPGSAVSTPPPASSGAPGPAGPLRVLILGGPGRERDEALAAASAMREPAAIAQLDPDAVPPGERAAAYRAADVVLTLPRIGGLPLAPLEAFHAGATCVATPVTGIDEYLVDGANGLLTSFDDERGTARLLDLLARDRVLLARLRTAARATAAAWPTEAQAAVALGAALRRIHDGARAVA